MVVVEINSVLPTNVDSKEQLTNLPEEYLSGDPERPLLYIDDHSGSKHHYALKPLFYSVCFILLIEMLEEFSYYGIIGIETPYLQGWYNEEWNANMTSVQASSFVSGSSAITYSSPFLGGIIADVFLGEFLTITLGVTLFYIPGLLLLALTTIPYLLGDTFNQVALTAGMMILYPFGAGFIKSVVNVFGAKQYHPILQSEMMESFYVNYYIAINVGGLVGGILIPLLAQYNVTVACMIPVGVLTLGLVCYLLGTKRYVRVPPRKYSICKTPKVMGSTATFEPVEQSKQSNNDNTINNPFFADGIMQLLAVIPVSALTIPFNIVFCQMMTVFMVQGMAMRNAGFVDAAQMVNVDSLSVIVFGFLMGNVLYPYLANREIHIATTHKFAFGTVFGGLAILSAIIVDKAILNALDSGKQISILWQSFTYALVGIGELFARSAAYEAAYVIAPKEQKGLASAINLFVTGAIPNFISVALYNACSMWFPSGNEENVNSLQYYAGSEVYKFLWVLFGISLFGILVNLLPPVKNWVERVNRRSAGLNTTTQVADSTPPLQQGDVEKQ